MNTYIQMTLIGSIRYHVYINKAFITAKVKNNKREKYFLKNVWKHFQIYTQCVCICACVCVFRLHCCCYWSPSCWSAQSPVAAQCENAAGRPPGRPRGSHCLSPHNSSPPVQINQSITQSISKSINQSFKVLCQSNS